MLLLLANSGTETHGQISCLALVCLFQTFSSRTQATANDCFVALDKMLGYLWFYRGADKSLARPGRKQATATKLSSNTGYREWLFCGFRENTGIPFIIPGADKFLARPGRKQGVATKLCFLQATQKKFRWLSVQPGLRDSNDLRVGRKMANFQYFFSRVGLRIYQHPCITLCSASLPSVVGLRSSLTWVSVGRAVVLEEPSYQTTRRHVPQYRSIHIHCCNNFEFNFSFALLNNINSCARHFVVPSLIEKVLNYIENKYK